MLIHCDTINEYNNTVIQLNKYYDIVIRFFCYRLIIGKEIFRFLPPHFAYLRNNIDRLQTQKYFNNIDRLQPKIYFK